MGQDKFSTRLLHWFDQHGRHTLPWQTEKSLYRVWVSEIMLQQTQVATVIPYYQRFMASFKDIEALALASIDEILAHWAGLGYYARGRNLHKAARLIMVEHQGNFPTQFETVIALPGIGHSTAGAILSLALDQRHAILDGNVKRALCRYHGIVAYPGEKKTEAMLWKLADQHTPHSRHGDYTQAIMDMGAILCTRSKPDCKACPQQNYCVALKQNATARIPRPKANKPKPCKHRIMLVLMDNDNQLSLFKRPSTGIWGGLYALPEFESKLACDKFLRSCKIDITKQTRVFGDIKHSLTHFDLLLTPLQCISSAAQQLLLIKQLAKCAESGILPGQHKLHTVTPRTLKPNFGIPVPIQKIIDQMPTDL